LTRPLARYALLALGIAGLSAAGVFYKLSAAPVVAIVAYRMLIASLLTAPLALARGAIAPRQGRAPFGRSDLAVSAAAGAFFAIDILLWASSLRFTSVASASLFVSTDPIFVAVFAWLLFRERPTGVLVAGIGVGIAGMVVVAGNDFRVAGHAAIGDGIALLASLLESGYLLVGRHVRQRVDALRYTLVLYTSCTLVLWLIVLATRSPATLQPHDLLIALALAVVATLLGHTIVSQSLGHLPAAVVAASFLAQPMLAALFALWFIRQPIPLATVVGGLIALAGIGIVAYANERRGLDTSTQAV